MMHLEKVSNSQHFSQRISSIVQLNVTGFNSEDDISRKTPTCIFFFCIVTLMVALCFFSSSAVGWAAEVKLTPKLAVGGAYDDNIFFTSKDKADSSLFTVSPSVELDYQTPVSNVLLNADWDVLKYIDESDLDRTNQYYRLSAGRRIKNRLDTSAELKFYQDTTLNTYLQETGRAVDRVQRNYFDGWGQVAYNLTEVSGISGKYRFQTASYDDDAYTDYDTHSANLYYFHRLKSMVDQLSLGPAYYHRTNDYSEVDSFSLNFGWNRDWSSITHSNAIIGARYSNFKPNDGTGEDHSWGAIARFLLTYQGEISTLNMDYYHDLQTTVDGSDINVDNFHLTYSRSITQRFGARFSGRLVFSYKLFDQESYVNDERYFWLAPSLFYLLTQNLEVSLQYRYQNNVAFVDNGDDITRERNIVWLQFSYALPILL